MKGLKKIGLIAMSLACVGIISSCGNSDIINDVTNLAANDIVIEDTDTTILNSISVNTNNTTKVFYLGQEFNYDGLIVVKSLAVFDSTGKRKGFVQQETKDYTVNYDEVNTNALGTYNVTVSVREGTTILTRSYNVEVKSSVFETTPNLTYCSGLEVLLSDSTRIRTYLKESTDYNFDDLVSELSIKLYKNTVSADGKSFTQLDAQTLSKSQVTIEQNIDINAVGTYLIKVKYTGDPLQINGTTYENVVSSFIIVDVVNPITNIAFLTEDATLFDATVDDLDYAAAGWKFRITPTVGKKYTVDFSYDLFDVSTIDLFKWNQTQDVTVTLKEDPNIKVVIPIMIKESQVQNITPYYTLTHNILSSNEAGNPTSISIAGTDFIYGPLPKAIDSDTYYTTGATYTTGREGKDKFGSIAFDERITIKGSEQAFTINLDKKTDFVVFFAPTGDEESDLTFFKKNADGTIGDEVETATTGDVKQVIIKHKYTLEAGSYYLIAPSAGIYVHGFVIATEKEAN